MTTPTAELADLKFPFVEVNDVDETFGHIPNLSEVSAACPTDFSNCRGWERAALTLQFTGWTEDRMKWAVAHLQTKNAAVAKAQVKYLNTWIRSFAPRQQEKQAVCAWLLSLMFTECPNWK